MVVVGSANHASPTEPEFSSRERANTGFSWESHLFEMIASGYPLPLIAESLGRSLELALDSAGRCAISLTDRGGFQFNSVMPLSPPRLRDAVRGHPVKCEAAPGAGAIQQKPSAANSESDPLWEFSGYRVTASVQGRTCCWSTPILSGSGELLGTLTILHDKPGRPTASQRQIIARASHIAGIAIERAQRDALMARYEGLLRQAQDVGAIGSFGWHLDSDAFTCSAAVYRIFQFDNALPVTYALILSRVHPADLPALHLQLERDRTHGADIAQEFRLLLPNQSVTHVRIAARAIRDPLGRREYLGAIQDITPYRVCEEALRQAKAELAYAARVMSLGELSASIAHEIKQPLSGIITNASTCLRMLASDPPDLAGARETAKRTLRDGNRASDIITRLRALFTRKTVSDEKVDLNQVAQEALTISFSDLRRRRITVLTEFSDEVPEIRGDRIQLHQVILNLLLNAADAMGAVDNRARRLKICTQLDGKDCAVLSVQDSGTGIGNHAARIFEPFYTTKADGMGIGLSISRDIIVKHGGRLWATQNDGPGATFCFSVPCVRKKVRLSSPTPSKLCTPARTGRAYKADEPSPSIGA